MKIAYIAAGAAGMYCGSCLHDNSLAASLRAAGADVVLVPTYTPTRTDEPNESIERIFYGGINVYLQQQLAIFRHTPWFLDRLLDTPALVSWLAVRGAASTRAEDLGDLTVSMLRGEEGHQSKELDKLLHFLAHDVRPDVVHLSNSMLLGLARRLGQQLGVPVLCTLSGEDIFLEKLVEPHYSEARRLLRERATDVAAFVALNRYYADFMSAYLQTTADKLRVIRHGLNLAMYPARAEARPGGAPPTIGYFARVCPEKGLHHLVEAFALLARDDSLPGVRLRAAGYLGGQDKPYLETILARVADLGLGDRFEYVGEVDRAGKLAFLQSLDVLSVPTVYRESKGISTLEALAVGVPVVLPEHGAFPEYVAETQAGLLHRPEDPADLAQRLRELLVDSAHACRLGDAGRAAIAERFTAEQMAREHLELYQSLVERPAPGAMTVEANVAQADTIRADALRATR